MSTRTVDLTLLGVAAVWGSSYLAAKVATEDLAVPVVLLGRYGLAFAACVMLLRTTHRGRPTATEWRLGVLLGVTQAAILALETWGVAGTTAASAGVLISLTILMTPGLEAVVLGRRLPPSFYAACGVSVVGVALLMSGDGWSGPRSGDLLVLSAAVVRAGHVVLVGRLASRDSVRPLSLTTVQLGVGTLVFAPLGIASLGDAGPGGGGGSPLAWACVLHLALGCSVFAFLAQTWGVQQTSASRASLLLGTEPVWAVACAAAVGGETLTSLVLLGSAIVVAGTWWGQAVEGRDRLPVGLPGTSADPIPGLSDLPGVAPPATTVS
ncbi:DMT family transporter [Nocardioides ferulae]|uniref:DMT family transporter n=1 Tax=Nocardioides ferulae TaxID=2340821 RepID=UPI000EB1EA15|nr:DMT family transporter [Nocardioides ferulae]